MAVGGIIRMFPWVKPYYYYGLGILLLFAVTLVYFDGRRHIARSKRIAAKRAARAQNQIKTD